MAIQKLFNYTLDTLKMKRDQVSRIEIVTKRTAKENGPV
jgi:hypothetical protein